MKPFVFFALVCLAAAVTAHPQNNQGRQSVPPTAAQEAEAVRFFELGNACPDDDHKCRIEAFTRAVTAYPSFAEAYNNRGSAYLLAGRRADALQDFSRALVADPSSVQALYNRAVLYSDGGDPNKAIADFQAAIKLQPELGLAFTGLGNALMKQQRYDAAELSFTRAIQLQPDFAANYFNRGLVYLFTDKLEKAEIDFSKALQLDDEMAPALLNRSICLREKGDLRAALSDIDEFIRRRPDDSRGYRTRANVYAKMGENARSEADKKRAAGMK